jgi:aminoglycoside 3-N-acetyltransferase
MEQRAEEKPVTLYSQESLKQNMEKIGIRPGMTLIVHSSYKAIGHVVGGPVAVILALEEALGETGTLVMPTFTEHLRDLAEEENHRPESQCELVRQHLPLYYPDLTPVDRHNGILTELFRKQQGVLRSAHPHLSFAAWGKHAQKIIEHHSFNNALGQQSPIARIYNLQGYVLLFGAPRDTNSSLHLSEYRQNSMNITPRVWDALMMVDGKRTWAQYHDIVNNSDIFPQILDAFLHHSDACRTGKIGDAESYFMSQPEIADFGVEWLNDHHR